MFIWKTWKYFLEIKNLSSVSMQIHPGAYVFYDAQQTGLGSCHPSEVAAKVKHLNPKWLQFLIKFGSIMASAIVVLLKWLPR